MTNDRRLESEDNYNLLFTASAKTLFLLGILDIRKNGVYFDGSNTTNRILDVSEEERPKIICIDELDKMPRTFQNQLLNFIESGRVKVDQQRKQYDFEINGTKVFAACNEINRLSEPLQSRFRKLFLPRYTEEKFLDVSEKVLPKLSPSLARYIGANVWKSRGDILVSVSNELEEFDKNFFSVLTKIKEKFDKLYLKKNYVTKKNNGTGETNQQNLVAFQPLLNVLSQSVEILYEVLDVYILRCILVWSKTVKKEDIIKKLYSIVISKISDIQFRMSEILSSFKAGNFYLVTQLSVYQRIYGTANFQRHLNDFKHSEISEIEQLLDSIWKINKDLLSNSCPEPALYKWDFDYKRDNWKKLLELQRKHPEQTYQNLVNKQLTYLSKPSE